MKTSELTNAALDWAVAKCEGNNFAGEYPHLLSSGFRPPKYSTDWSQGGPIIEREFITVLSPMTGNSWDARDGKSLKTPFVYWSGPTPLIAAMRCYVASKLGDNIDIPEILK